MQKHISFLRSRNGGAAVEFALVAPVLFLMAFMSLEIGIAEAQAHAVRSALAEAARGVRTGVVQKADHPEAKFRELLCQGGMGIIDCHRIRYDVRAFANIAAVTYVEPQLDANGQVPNFRFTPGGADTVMGLQAVYLVDINTPILAYTLNPTGQGMIVRAQSIVRGEPWAM